VISGEKNLKEEMFNISKNISVEIQELLKAEE
jgi:hypothetical protein